MRKALLKCKRKKQNQETKREIMVMKDRVQRANPQISDVIEEEPRTNGLEIIIKDILEENLAAQKSFRS